MTETAVSITVDDGIYFTNKQMKTPEDLIIQDYVTLS